ncbi:hypothetical protein [Streptomyces sp. CAI 127]|uniref:hypothetical protein n=1 Tax=Streptomyces sp. CAI 127 TaxID=1076397 RepID=UPI0015872117|nr:hypothetical protein [Streptomyces sp. CAI 127]NUW02874.1 hypothetical protein [Streptomyces sp. CAI 127]
MSSEPDIRNAAPSGAGQEPGPLLTAHAAIVLMMAILIGMVIGVLTFLSVGDAAAALLAGLTGSGFSIPVLHKHIG